MRTGRSNKAGPGSGWTYRELRTTCLHTQLVHEPFGLTRFWSRGLRLLYFSLVFGVGPENVYFYLVRRLVPETLFDLSVP